MIDYCQATNRCYSAYIINEGTDTELTQEYVGTPRKLCMSIRNGENLDTIHVRGRKYGRKSSLYATIIGIDSMTPHVSEFIAPIGSCTYGYALPMLRQMVRDFGIVSISKSGIRSVTGKKLSCQDIQEIQDVCKIFGIEMVEGMPYPKIEVRIWDTDESNALPDGKSTGLIFSDSKNHTEIGVAIVNTVHNDRPFLYNFFINPEFRNQGYGHAAMQYMIDTYGVSTLSVLSDNDVAMHLYKSFGFHVAYSYVENGNNLLYMVRDNSGR